MIHAGENYRVYRCGSVSDCMQYSHSWRRGNRDHQRDTGLGAHMDVAWARLPPSPCVVKVSRKTELTAYAAAKGYRSGSLLVKSTLTDKAAPGVLGNAVLPGGSLGLVLDAANGAMLDHTPNPAHIDLVPLRSARAR
jgi:hypothetical protein